MECVGTLLSWMTAESFPARWIPIMEESNRPTCYLAVRAPAPSPGGWRCRSRRGAGSTSLTRAAGLPPGLLRRPPITDRPRYGEDARISQHHEQDLANVSPGEHGGPVRSPNAAGCSSRTRWQCRPLPAGGGPPASGDAHDDVKNHNYVVHRPVQSDWKRRLYSSRLPATRCRRTARIQLAPPTGPSTSGWSADPGIFGLTLPRRSPHRSAASPRTC